MAQIIDERYFFSVLLTFTSFLQDVAVTFKSLNN